MSLGTVRFWVFAAYVAAIDGIVCFEILQAHRFALTTPAAVIYCIHIVAVLLLCLSARAKINRTARALLHGKKAAGGASRPGL